MKASFGKSRSSSTRPSRPYVRQRQWHRSQEIDNRVDGTILLRLEVSLDWPLRRWILGFGASARVLAPASLAREIAEQWTRASDSYRAAPKPEMARMHVARPNRGLMSAS